VNICRYFFNSKSLLWVKYWVYRHLSKEREPAKGNTCSLIIIRIESSKFYASPSFLYFYSASLTKHYINWNLTRPLSGTKEFPFQSVPDIELVVIKVRSVILSGVSLLIILACWQNSVHALFETAQTSPKGLQEEKYR